MRLLDPHALKLYIDGAAYKNPGGPGGFAIIAEYPEDWNRPNEELFREGYRETTNNRMELSACIRTMEYVCEMAQTMGVQRVLIVTDSLYVANNVHYLKAWRRKQWRTSAGRPVDNPDLWKKLLSLQTKLRIRTEIIWTKGKSTPTLKAVDRAAKNAASQPFGTDWGFRPGKIGRSKSVTKGASNLFPARGQEIVIRVYRSGFVGKSVHKIFFDLYSEDKKEFAEKFRAYAEPVQAAELHRGHCYRVRFNDNPKYPVIESVIQELNVV